jgi:hypothetical protein
MQNRYEYKVHEDEIRSIIADRMKERYRGNKARSGNKKVYHRKRSEI